MMEPPPPPPAVAAADLLSSFPAHLLDEILVRLRLRDAVRTSALSRAWRRRWESIPGIVLSFPDGTPPGVVDRVLLHHTGPGVSRFKFPLNNASASHVDHWLVALSRRGVESISIGLGVAFPPCPRPTLHSSIFSCAFPPCPRPTLHSSIFSCARLVSLNLGWFVIPPLPVGFAGFPVLEALYLNSVKFSDVEPSDGGSPLEAIIRGSPLLRLLYLKDVEDPWKCEIEAPNLHSLTLVSHDDVGGWLFGELPCLQYASIDVGLYEEHDQDFDEVLAQVAQVRELTLSSPGHDVKIYTTSFTFYNLKSLELNTSFYDEINILITFCLLRSSPNLEKLKIEIRQDWEKREENVEHLSAQWTDAQWTDGMCANLDVVEIISFDGWLPMSFMKLILCKACCLRTFSVDVRPVPQDNPLNELLKCRKASAQAQVLFEVKLEDISFHRMMKMKYDAENDSSDKEKEGAENDSSEKEGAENDSSEEESAENDSYDSYGEESAENDSSEEEA